MKISVLGLDLGKNRCSVVGLGGSGRVVLRRRMQRDSVIKYASGLEPCTVAMEACCGAHHLGRLCASKATKCEQDIDRTDVPKKLFREEARRAREFLERMFGA